MHNNRILTGCCAILYTKNNFKYIILHTTPTSLLHPLLMRLTHFKGPLLLFFLLNSHVPFFPFSPHSSIISYFSQHISAPLPYCYHFTSTFITNPPTSVFFPYEQIFYMQDPSFPGIIVEEIHSISHQAFILLHASRHGWGSTGGLRGILVRDGHTCRRVGVQFC